MAQARLGNQVLRIVPLPGGAYRLRVGYLLPFNRVLGPSGEISRAVALTLPGMVDTGGGFIRLGSTMLSFRRDWSRGVTTLALSTGWSRDLSPEEAAAIKAAVAEATR